MLSKDVTKAKRQELQRDFKGISKSENYKKYIRLDKKAIREFKENGATIKYFNLSKKRQHFYGKMLKELGI